MMGAPTEQGHEQAPQSAWACPNTPRCEHPAWSHDIDSYDDTKAMCCADDCQCGRLPAAPREA